MLILIKRVPAAIAPHTSNVYHETTCGICALHVGTSHQPEHFTPTHPRIRPRNLASTTSRVCQTIPKGPKLAALSAMPRLTALSRASAKPGLSVPLFEHYIARRPCARWNPGRGIVGAIRLIVGEPGAVFA